MKTKINKLSEAVVDMARVEERMKAAYKRLNMSDDAWKKYGDRMDQIQRKALIKGQKIAYDERIFWMIPTAVVSLCFSYTPDNLYF